MCVWAGEAEVLVSISKKGEKSEEKIVKIAAITQLSPLFLSSDLKISAYNLLPYPDGIEKESDVNYSLQLTFKEITKSDKD
ncbi:hypothetical protein [Olleya sp. R77988]|uniref:hypothetical protein n=1 Tax=Olleya sp. R77988 TaxID=3093875 RepID=UPI0037CB893B